MRSPPHFAGRRALLHAMPVAASLLAAPAFGQSPGIPAVPVKLVVGFGPGTSMDIIARTVARKVEEAWTAGVVVDNRTGAGGLIAVNQVGTSPPDGLTLLLGEFGSIAIAPNVYRKLQFDPAALLPVANLVAGEMCFVVGSQTGLKTMKDWRRWSQAASPLLIGTFGPATPHHLSAALLGEAVGKPVQPVHFRAVQEVLASAASGELHGAFVSTTLAVAWAQTGKVNILAVNSPVRAVLLPDVETFRESGLESAEYEGWIGVFAPPRTPDSLLDRAHSAFNTAVGSAEVRKKMEELGVRVIAAPRKAFEDRIRTDRASVKRLTDALDLKLD